MSGIAAAVAAKTVHGNRPVNCLADRLTSSTWRLRRFRLSRIFTAGAESSPPNAGLSPKNARKSI